LKPLRLALEERRVPSINYALTEGGKEPARRYELGPKKVTPGGEKKDEKRENLHAPSPLRRRNMMLSHGRATRREPRQTIKSRNRKKTEQGSKIS